MKIAIDCRYLGMSGIGRVCRGILDNLDYSTDKYYLVGDRSKLSTYKDAEIIDDATNPFSKSGLFGFAKERINNECECLITPNFIIPYGIKVPVYTVMHDLIFRDLKITTKNFADRAIKKHLLKRCMKKSERVACVSEFTIGRCRHYYKKLADKCYLAYPGISSPLKEYRETHTFPVEKEEKIVFVGNVKPHKGLKILLSAFEKTVGLKLKIIGERENFITGLKLDESAYKNVEFTGKLSDEELFDEIATAKYLVLPSLYEGFGAPPMEALYLDTVPIVSDLPVFREVYGDFPVIFFKDEEDLAQLLMGNASKINVAEEVFGQYNYKKFVETMMDKILSEKPKK